MNRAVYRDISTVEALARFNHDRYCAESDTWSSASVEHKRYWLNDARDEMKGAANVA